jgi:hypothetical protein
MLGDGAGQYFAGELRKRPGLAGAQQNLKRMDGWREDTHAEHDCKDKGSLEKRVKTDARWVFFHRLVFLREI